MLSKLLKNMDTKGEPVSPAADLSAARGNNEHTGFVRPALSPADFASFPHAAPRITSEAESTPRRRIEWEETEIDAVAKAFVAERLSNPFLSAKVLVMKAQKDTLPEHRRRNFPAIPICLRARIGHHWRVAASKEAGDPPTPLIVQVETPKPFDYSEALATLDSPTLAALLMGKLGQLVRGLQAQLDAIPGRGVNTKPAASPLPAAPPLTMFASVEKRKPRVVVIGPLNGQMHEIEQQVEQFKIPIEVRFADKEASNTGLPTSCDYAIVTRHSRHKWWDAACKQAGHSRVFFIDGGISQVVQKLRDIASRQ